MKCYKCGMIYDEHMGGCPYCENGPVQAFQEAAPAVAYNSHSIAAFILGILACIASYMIIPGIILGIAAIVFGIIGQRSERKGMAIAGIVLGILSILSSLFFMFCTISALAYMYGYNLYYGF